MEQDGAFSYQYKLRPGINHNSHAIVSLPFPYNLRGPLRSGQGGIADQAESSTARWDAPLLSSKSPRILSIPCRRIPRHSTVINHHIFASVISIRHSHSIVSDGLGNISVTAHLRFMHIRGRGRDIQPINQVIFLTPKRDQDPTLIREISYFLILVGCKSELFPAQIDQSASSEEKD